MHIVYFVRSNLYLSGVIGCSLIVNVMLITLSFEIYRYVYSLGDLIFIHYRYHIVVNKVGCRVYSLGRVGDSGRCRVGGLGEV